MANRSVEETVLRIGPPELPPAPGRGRRYCAEASLVLAVLGLACTVSGMGWDVVELLMLGVFFCTPLTLVLGVIGRGRVGESKAVANCALLLTLPVFLLCLMPANSRARGPARRAQFTNNMKQVGIALDNYHEAYGRLPPAAVCDRAGRPLYSWRVLILPFMEVDSLYREFHLDERWDSPHNRSLLAKAPGPYRGVGVDDDHPEITHIQVFVGPGSAFESSEGEPFAHPDGSSNFPDGMENTILAIGAREGVPWSAPFDLPSGPDEPLVALGGGYLRDRGLMESQPKIKDFVVLFADGSVKSKPWPIDGNILRAWVTRNGGETTPVDSPD